MHYTKPLFLMFFLLIGFLGQAQIKIYQDGSYIKADITDEQKDEIMASATNIMNKYAKVASFLDDNMQFSDDAYSDFISIFSGSAEVFDDLAKKDAQNINYGTYADKVYEYMQGTGVKFELNEVYLDEIAYDSSGFYQVTVSFEKIMFNGLDKDNKFVNYPNNGRTINLKMVIEVPEYDLSAPSIISIKGEATKVKVESATMISTDLNFHLGNISKTTSDLAVGFDGNIPVSYNSYGIDAVFRRSINNKKSIYILAGLSLNFNNFRTNLNEFTGGGSFSSAAGIRAEIGGAGFTPTGTFTEEDFPTVRTILFEEVNTLSERLQVIDIYIPLGVSLRLVESYNYDIFLDVAAVPIYSISSSGRYTGELAFVQFPEDRSNFSEGFELYVLDQFDNGNVIEDYFGQSDFNEELVETGNKFSAAVQVTPLFHYKFNFNMALEAGLNVSYNFLPYFQNETNHLGERVELSGLPDISGAENPSVLQQNFKDIGVLRYGARIGLVFKL